MSLGLILNVIVGFSVVDGRWRGREAILDLDFTISHRCKCQFCQKRFSLRVLALRRVYKQMTIVAMRPCCKTGAKVVLRRSTTLTALCLWSSRWIENLESVILYPIISCFIIVDAFYAGNYSTFFRGSLHRTDCCMCGKYPSDYCRLFCVGGFP